ncbi:MAG: ATP-binding protein, partial [Nitrospirae bacterium]|nr:ATP-binding protein [Nitrospirota bacterium]
KSCDIEERLKEIQRSFKLTDIELEVLSFYYLIEESTILDRYLKNEIPFGTYAFFRNYGHYLLSVNRSAFIESISKGTLVDAHILEFTGYDNLQLGISSWCRGYLTKMSSNNCLGDEFFTKENNETLKITDFFVSEDELAILNFLIENKDKQNILLHGSPGTGKTSLVRSIAKHNGMEVLAVKIDEDGEVSNRFGAIYASVRLANDNSIILIDEADEILNSERSFFFKSQVNKSWINNFLDGHDKKIIWVTNRTSEIAPSTMRRFSFSIEFKAFDEMKRLKVLKSSLNQAGIKDYFTEDELKSLCKNYSVNAGGIVDSIKVLKITNKTKKDQALKMLNTVLKNHERIIGGEKNSTSDKEFEHYTLEGLNTSHKLDNIISIIKKYISDKVKTQSLRHSVTLLLHGLPGTGKSEFVYYLGDALNQEVLLKRCSDIQSMWVGQTEKNIAEAFREAAEDNKILFFDEADTFLYPRNMANHSWEKSFTNELLTQIESFKGIVFFATNELAGLDQAALRRFKFKIEFLPLKPEGNLLFYKKLLSPLVYDGSELKDKEIIQIKGIVNLTPGDFAVIKEQNIFVDGTEITHKKLIAELK